MSYHGGPFDLIQVGGCSCPCCNPCHPLPDYWIPFEIQPAVDTFAHIVLAQALFGWLP